MGRPKVSDALKKVRVSFAIDPDIDKKIKSKPVRKQSKYANKLLKMGLKQEEDEMKVKTKFEFK